MPPYSDQRRLQVTLRTARIVEPIGVQISVTTYSPTEKLITIQASENGHFLLKVWFVDYPDAGEYDSIAFSEASAVDRVTDDDGKVEILRAASAAHAFRVCVVVAKRVTRDGLEWEGLTRTEEIPEAATLVVYGGYLQGPKGEPGTGAGDPGPQGERGPRGPGGIGPAGPRGIQGPAGERGPQGIQGIQGVRGLQGIPGPEGEKGEPGATIAVGTVTTLPAGYLATVENVGDETDMVLDFGIPRGSKGDKGDQGIDGPQGIQGAEGPQGPRGSDGPPGIQGPVGVGIKGDKGDPGAAATIEVGDVTVETLDPGEDATVVVTNTGDENEAVFKFEFGIPQGDVGPGVAAGGAAGQVLRKKSATEYDTEWTAAGTNGQVLTLDASLKAVWAPAPTGTLPSGTDDLDTLLWSTVGDGEWLSVGFDDALVLAVPKNGGGTGTVGQILTLVTAPMGVTPVWDDATASVPDGTDDGDMLVWGPVGETPASWHVLPFSSIFPSVYVGNANGALLRWKDDDWGVLDFADLVENDVLLWNGTDWVNSPVTVDLPTGTNAGDLLQWVEAAGEDAAHWVATTVGDSIAEGDLLQWDDTKKIWKRVAKAEVTVITDWQYDVSNKLLQKKTCSVVVVSAGTESGWTTVTGGEAVVES